MNRVAKYHPADKVEFYKILSSDVNLYLSRQKNGRFANNFMLFKIVFCFSVYMITLSQYLFSNSNFGIWLLWCLAIGASSLLMGVNIGHDAVHNCISKKRWINRFAAHSFDIIGVSSFTWKIKHNILHHQFPNVTEVDYDIEAGPVLRFSPAEPLKWFHRYQQWYAPFVYILFSMHLVFLNDIKIVREMKMYKGADYLTRIVPGKLIYISLMLVLPMFTLSFAWWQIIAGFLLMHFTLSFLLAMLLLPSHLFDTTKFSHVKEGSIDEDWTMHQLETTLDFAQQSFIAHFLFGGFNTNVIHHLFPNICHCHYRALSKLLESRTAATGIVYHKATLIGAVKSHFRALKNLGDENYQPA